MKAETLRRVRIRSQRQSTRLWVVLVVIGMVQVTQICQLYSRGEWMRQAEERIVNLESRTDDLMFATVGKGLNSE